MKNKWIAAYIFYECYEVVIWKIAVEMGSFQWKVLICLQCDDDSTVNARISAGFRGGAYSKVGANSSICGKLYMKTYWNFHGRFSVHENFTPQKTMSENLTSESLKGQSCKMKWVENL